MENLVQIIINEYKKDNFLRKITEKYPNRSLEELEMIITEEIWEHTSNFYFPGNLCEFMPQIREHKTKTARTCQISGGVIYPGSYYLAYRPFILNRTINKKYVLRNSIITETGYYDFFPQTLKEFEELVSNLGNPYEIETNGINYYQLSKSLGEYLPLQELGKRRKKVRK